MRCPGGYAENDNVLVWYGKGKSLKTYQVCLVLLTRESTLFVLSSTRSVYLLCGACVCVCV